MQRFWIALPIALALTAPPAFAGKLDSVTKAAKTYIAKKEAGSSASHGAAKLGHGKASGIVAKSKKFLGK